MIGRLADMCNVWWRGDDDWAERMAIIARAAEKVGRDPSTIEVTSTVEKPLPETDADSEALVELL
ncbi:MAG TPA: LLM class flavin-dependent oxidoreductase, partial [Acidimicrobiaceae bacterium]|nr:LLM class flavin-dependent oxidoreductase [Acidimicrobiaceae bacterium]